MPISQASESQEVETWNSQSSVAFRSAANNLVPCPRHRVGHTFVCNSEGSGRPVSSLGSPVWDRGLGQQLDRSFPGGDHGEASFQRSLTLDDASGDGSPPEPPGGRGKGRTHAALWRPRVAFSLGPRRRTAPAVCVGQSQGRVDGISVRRSGASGIPGRRSAVSGTRTQPVRRGRAGRAPFPRSFRRWRFR